MSDRDDEEARAKAWLHAQGYIGSRPTWLPRGRNPDFWAESATLAPPHLWAEVKSIEPDDSTAALSRFRSVIASAKIPPGLRGHGMVYIEPHAIEQSVVWVLKAFARHAPKFADQKVVLAFVQQSRDGRDVRRAEVDASVPEILWVRGADIGPMHPPIGVCKESFAPARVFHPGGEKRVGKTFEFFDWTGSTECSLVARIDPAGRPLDGLTSMSGGSGQTRDRTVRALEDANGQIKTACVTRDAPGIVLLVPRGPFVDDTMIAAAAYGHLTLPLTLKDGCVEHGKTYYGLDGVFRRNKNTHISVAVHVRREGTVTFFPNPHARHPIPDDARIFAGGVRADVEFV
jgi:hypothetical protein